MPRKGRTRQYQSHTLKLRHWLLEVKIHRFPRRGAACHPHPSCCSPGTRLCPLWGQRDAGSGAVPQQSSPCHPAQPRQGSQSIHKKTLLPPQITLNYCNLSRVPREGHSAEQLFHPFSAQPGKLNCDTAQHLFCLCLLDRPSCWVFSFLNFFFLVWLVFGAFSRTAQQFQSLSPSPGQNRLSPMSWGLKSPQLQQQGEKNWILPEAQCRVKFPY